MDGGDGAENLNRISTQWSVVRRAHAGPPEAAAPALQALVERYSGAVYRYLLGALHDPHAADDLAQELSLRLVRGDFRNADPRRGRFRDLVKTALFHLIVDYQRRRKGVPQTLPPDECGPAGPEPDTPASERDFAESWRQQLLAQAWSGLAKYDRRHGSRYYEVLRFRAENREATSAEMARRLGARLGKSVTPEWVRQTLRRAREQFAGLLLEELAQSLESPTREALAEELAELRLLTYCREALEQWPPG
jgi:RNA polymerase sigma-70 factor (ECF subfamily)